MDKQHTLTLNSGQIKLELLLSGINPNSRIQLNDQDAPQRYVYDTSNNYEGHLPSEIILPGGVISNIYFSKDSDWSIQGQMLQHKNQNISGITFTPDAKFTKLNLNSGISASKVAIMYGLDIFAVFLNKTCAYFSNDNDCHFCGLEYTKKNAGRENIQNPTLNQVVEVFQLALKQDFDSFNNVMITSGAYENPDQGIRKQMEYLLRMKQLQGNKRVKYHLVTVPPKSRELLKELSEHGPDTIAFDIEVFNQDLFSKYCPGKEKQIGYKDYLRIFEDAAKIFPANAVKAGFVLGLEPIESLVEGMEFFGKLGVSSSLNIFHPDLGSKLQHEPRPDKEYVVEALKQQKRIMQAHNLIPIFPNYGRRSSLDTEVYKGML